MRCFLHVVFLFLIFHISFANYELHETTFDDVLANLKNVEKLLKDLVDDSLKQWMPFFIRLSSKVDISSECQEHLLKIVYSLRQLKTWAIKMVDSEGKLPAGVLSGVIGNNGDFDECVSVKIPSSFEQPIKSHYCPVYLRPKLPKNLDLRRVTSKTNLFMNSSAYFDEDTLFEELLRRVPLLYRLYIRQGFCMPTSCSAQEVQQMATVGFGEFGWEAIVPYCNDGVTMKPVTGQIAILAILFILTLFAVVATASDWIIKDMNNVSGFFIALSSFSLRRSANLLFESSRTNNKRMDFMDGLRGFIILWIILAHTYGFIHPYGTSGILNMEIMLENYSFQAIANSWPIVETFFVIGGMLVALSNIKHILSGFGIMKLFKFYVRRLIRLWPVLLFTVSAMFIAPLIGSGPLFPETFLRETLQCTKTWWASIFFLNSWLSYDQMCLVHSWYISADLQLFLLSPVFVYALLKSRFIGITLCLSTIICFNVYMAVETYLYALPPAIIFGAIDEGFMKEGMKHSYFRPYCHLSPYVIGILLAYAFTTLEKIHLKWWQLGLGWTCTVTLSLATFLTPYQWHNGILPSPLVASVYQSLYKTAWALAVAWVIFTCKYGYAGIINRTLSSPRWKVLSRLTYCMYLLNMPIIWFRIASIRGNVHLNHYNLVYEFFGNLIVTIIASTIVHLLIEAPFLNLDELLFPAIKHQDGTESAVEQTKSSQAVTSKAEGIKLEDLTQ